MNKCYWLIEHEQMAPRRYWRQDATGGNEWVEEPSKATRFATEQEAREFTTDPLHRPYEHMDCDGPSPLPQKGDS